MNGCGGQNQALGEAVLVGVCDVITFVFDNQLMKQGKLRCLN